MSDSIANGYGCRPCKQVQLNVTDAILHFIGDGSALSNLNASNVEFGTLSTSVFPASGVSVGTYGSSANVAQVTIDTYGRVTAATNVAITSSQWTGTPGSPIYYIPSVGIGSSTPATANLEVTGNVYVSNSLTTTNIFATTANIATMNVSYLTADSAVVYGSSLNVYGTSNLTNVMVTDTFNVNGSMTANAANATFFFDTLTIPYTNTQYINVASTANIATTNTQTLSVTTNMNFTGSLATFSNLQVTGNAYISNSLTTTNVFANTLTMSNATSTINVTGNIYASNAITTTNVFTNGCVGIGTTNPRAQLHVSGIVATNVNAYNYYNYTFPTPGVYYVVLEYNMFSDTNIIDGWNVCVGGGNNPHVTKIAGTGNFLRALVVSQFVVRFGSANSLPANYNNSTYNLRVALLCAQ